MLTQLPPVQVTTVVEFPNLDAALDRLGIPIVQRHYYLRRNQTDFAVSNLVSAVNKRLRWGTDNCVIVCKVHGDGKSLESVFDGLWSEWR